MKDIKAVIFNCNLETYKKYYKDAIKRAFLKDNIEINVNDIKIEVEELEGNTIQAQKSKERHSRTIAVYWGDNLEYIIGFSNTSYDEDRRKEAETSEREYNYGNGDWHSNTYLCQGINKIFSRYYEEKKTYPEAKLFFYLLDAKTKTYPHNLSNLLTYRELATIGFDILNLDEISFDNFTTLGFDMKEAHDGIRYVSFTKFLNDMATISRKNTGNLPSYLKEINYGYDVDDGDEWKRENSSVKYIYMFKGLGAQAYDSFLVMWTLSILAEDEKKDLEFAFVPEKWNYRLGQENIKYTEDLPATIFEIIKTVGLDIHYETSNEVRQQFDREEKQYEKASKKKDIRNQELFRNNLRKKGVPMKCPLCGCEIEDILEAAHVWGVSEISNCSSEEIDNVLSEDVMDEIIDKDNVHHQEDFYKRYVLANNGDNGVWMCANHHGLFDSNYYCFDSECGKILVMKSENSEFFDEITTSRMLPPSILSDRTKVFLEKRKQCCTLA